MFRITTRTERDLTTLLLEGHLDAEGAAELDRLTAPLAREHRLDRLCLHLHGLCFADEAGLACLCRLLAAGAHQVGGSAFVAQLLKECTS